MSKVEAALALGVVVLCVAIVGPSLIDSTNNDVSETVNIYENQSDDPTDKLRVTSERVRPTQGTALIEVESLATLNSSTQQLNETESVDFVVDEQTVEVTLNAAVDGDNAEFSRLTVLYPPDFGWQDSASTLMDNMGLLIALAGFIIIGGVLAVVIR